MQNKRYKTVLAALALTLCLCGCANSTDEEKALAAFSSSIAGFTSNIKEANEQINGIDTTQSEAPAELLEILDRLDEEFVKLAELSVPEQYLGVEALADEASQNMSEAVSYYHSAFEAEVFSESDADVAYQYYKRAMMRVEYIGYILAGGEIPENEHITIYEETNDHNIIDRWFDDEDEEN
ncbi:MAG: hypothetical protein NC337_07265 [Roseburia sp.]|nr:hypothetical protein [Roseburia sp.]